MPRVVNTASLRGCCGRQPGDPWDIEVKFVAAPPYSCPARPPQLAALVGIIHSCQARFFFGATQDP